MNSRMYHKNYKLNSYTSLFQNIDMPVYTDEIKYDYNVV